MREQFRIAEGGLIDYDDPAPVGHSFEFRINGEDPGRNFLPQPGPVHVLRFPGGPGVRVDSGVTTGDVISGAFDSLLAKLIVTGADREEALERSRRALEEFEVAGLPTVLPFHRDIVTNPAFAPEDGKPFSVYTRWIETEYDNQLEPWTGEAEEIQGPAARQSVVVEVDGRRVEVSLPKKLIPGASGPLTVGPAPKRRHSGAVATATGNSVAAPMQATIVKVAVEDGKKVVAGDLVVVLEAMKMETNILAAAAGTVERIYVSEGQQVKAGEMVAKLK